MLINVNTKVSIIRIIMENPNFKDSYTTILLLRMEMYI